MQVRHEGRWSLCPGCGQRFTETRIDPSTLLGRVVRKPACRWNVVARPSEDVDFDASDQVSSSEIDSSWLGWLVD